MGIIGRSEVEITADVARFEKQLQSQVNKATSKTTAKVPVEVDTSRSANAIKSFTGLFDTADEKLKKFGVTTRDLSILMGAGLAGGTIFAARTMLDFVSSSVEAASALNEQRDAAEVVFGAQSKLVEVFAQSAEALGFSERAALQSSIAFAALFKDIQGLSGKQVADLSTGLVSLAADISSLRNLPTDDVFNKLKSGLVGQREPLDAIGKGFGELQVQAEASRIGLGGANVEIGESEKKLARLSLIIEKSKDDFGNLGDTAGSLANQQRILNAQIENTKAELGTNLAPVQARATKLFSGIIGALENVAGVAAGGLTGNVEGVTNSLKGLISLEGVDEVFTGTSKAAVEASTSYADMRAQVDAAAEAVKRQAQANLLGIPTLQQLAQAAADAAATFSAATSGFESRLDTFTPTFGEDFRKDSDKSAAAAGKASDAAQRLARANEDASRRITDAQREIGDAARDAAQQAADAQLDLSRLIRDSAEDVSNARESLVKANTDAHERIAESEERLAETRVTAAKRVLDAETSLLDLQSDLASRMDDLADRAANALERVADASRSVADARKDASERVADAEKALAQVDGTREKFLRSLTRKQREELKQSEALAEAQHNLADAREDGAQRIADAERHELEARDALAEDQAEVVKGQQDAATTIAKAQVEVVAAQQQAAKDIRDAQKDRADAIEESTARVSDAQAELAKTLRESDERIADSQKDLERLEVSSNERIADAKRKLQQTQVEVARSIVDANEAIGKSAAGAAKDTEVSVKSLTKSFHTNADDLDSFSGSLDTITDHLGDFATDVQGIADKDVKQAFLAELSALGPGAAPLLRDLAKISDKELEGVVEAFGSQIKAAKRAADFQFDKFPANFGEKIEAMRQASASKLRDIIGEFEQLPIHAGPAFDKVNLAAFNMVLQLDKAVESGVLTLTKQEKEFLNLAESTNDPQARIDALKALMKSLQSRQLAVNVDTDQALAAIDALKIKLQDLLNVSTGSPTDLTLLNLLSNRDSRRMAGGPVTAGDAFIVGERGPEMFFPTQNGEVVNNDVVMKLIATLQKGTTGGGQVTIIVNEVANDPRATANAVAARLGRQSTR